MVHKDSSTAYFFIVGLLTISHGLYQHIKFVQLWQHLECSAFLGVLVHVCLKAELHRELLLCWWRHVKWKLQSKQADTECFDLFCHLLLPNSIKTINYYYNCSILRHGAMSLPRLLFHSAGMQHGRKKENVTVALVFVVLPWAIPRPVLCSAQPAPGRPPPGGRSSIRASSSCRPWGCEWCCTLTGSAPSGGCGLWRTCNTGGRERGEG